MINFKCRSCGAEMSVSRTGDLCCSYCGSKSVFTDSELREYKEFRYRMLSYLSTISDHADPAETDRIWRNAETEALTLSDGRPLRIAYLFKGMQDGVTVYTARRNVLFVFPKEENAGSERFSAMTGMLSYPSADIKKLSQFFPVIVGRFELDDGRVLLSVSKEEELYPLSAFGSLPPEHTAWVVSRLENICCVLAYSGLSHRGIDPESVFINARTHQAYLLGGWWHASVRDGGDRQDLLELRAVARRTVGIQYEEAPAEFRRFITDPPAENAFDDFSLWDQVIETGFHGRVYRKLDLSRLQF